MLFDELIEQSEEIVILKILFQEISFFLEEGIEQIVYKAKVINVLKGNLVAEKEIKLITDRYFFLANKDGKQIVEEIDICIGGQFIGFLKSTSSNSGDFLNYQLTDRWLGIKETTPYIIHYIENQQ